MVVNVLLLGCFVLLIHSWWLLGCLKCVTRVFCNVDTWWSVLVGFKLVARVLWVVAKAVEKLLLGCFVMSIHGGVVLLVSKWLLGCFGWLLGC